MKRLVGKGSAGFVALCLGTTLAVSVTTASAAPGGGRPDGQDPPPEEQVSKMEKHWKSEANPGRSSRSKAPVLRRKLLAKALPDECFAGIGEPYPEGTRDEDGNLVCPEGSLPKVNPAYVWGLTKAGDDLWFGTGPNIHCLVTGTYLATTTANQTDSWVCEGEESTYRTTWTPGATLPPYLGDFRPPDIFVYRQAAGTLTELTDLDAVGRARLHSTLGIRSAGSIGDHVFLAGPALSLTGGLNVFVFETDGDYVGSETLAGFTNVRKWVEVGGQLYTGVATAGGGSVLRYTGSSAADPFQYEVVGDLAGEPAELAEHDGRLFAATWPVGATLASLWMSPEIGGDGQLGPADAAGWQQVWSADEYEPDRVTARTYGGGALVSYGGQLYWGTMHVPLTAALAHAEVYGPSETTREALANVLGSHRAISIFRGDGFGTGAQNVELLYGARRLPVFDGVTWRLRPNAMGGVGPTYGPSGFGNVFNNYTWTMGVFDGGLYVGTMDWSYLVGAGLGPVLTELGLPNGADLPFPEDLYGADLWRFPAPGRPAVRESLDGVGNYTNYGIRTMVSDDALYLGTANPMNLMTDLTDDKPEGGWELLRLTPKWASKR